MLYIINNTLFLQLYNIWVGFYDIRWIQCCSKVSLIPSIFTFLYIIIIIILKIMSFIYNITVNILMWMKQCESKQWARSWKSESSIIFCSTSDDIFFHYFCNHRPNSAGIARCPKLCLHRRWSCRRCCLRSLPAPRLNLNS